MDVPVEPLPKHARYESVYKPGDTFWGIGIENETYLQLSDGIIKPAECLMNNRARERYSVDYWGNYKKDIVDKILHTWIASLPEKWRTTVKFPLLMNAHAFTNTDIRGEPKTTYAKNPVPNPKYAGKSLYEVLAEHDSKTFKDGKDVWWTFDGDTIEFITQGFYCAKMEDVIAELLDIKERFREAVQSGLDAVLDKESLLTQRIIYPKRNHGFAIYTTNRNNIGVFNNGTYHFNITLPTRLDKDAKIANYELFEIQHRNAARLFQWLSPFLIAKYGSGDIFASFFGKDPRFSAGSQRLAVSRYISVANYDTEKMPRGKILTMSYNYGKYYWYERIHDLSGWAYNRLSNIGVDINYNKHWNHGLEFRIFDWFPEEYLSELLRLLIWMCDESLLYKTVDDPRNSILYNDFVTRTIIEGPITVITYEEATLFSKVFNVVVSPLINVLDALIVIYNAWKHRWNNSKNSCTMRMIRHPLPQLSDSIKVDGHEERTVQVVNPFRYCCC